MVAVPPPARLRRTRLIATAGAALAFAGGAPVAAATLPPTAAPLPGSSFQAADGNQAAAPPLTDWASLQAGGRVTHVPDPNAQDDAFKGGSKEEEPGDWDFAVEPGGVNPGNANIRDAWASVDQPGGRTFLYLAFAREASDGTTFVTFELNRDGRLWDNGRARVPCRHTDDVLVSYEPQGNTVDVIVQRWVTTESDSGSGCATRGRLDSLSRLTANVDVQGAVNRAQIANSLPGAYGATMPAERFGEAGIDLARVLGQTAGGSCLAFTSVWMYSRSSTSESSNMQDYVAPAALDLRTCAASGTKFLDRDADGLRDAIDPGLPRFVVFADYDDDGAQDANEPFTITASDGRYVLDDIRPPDGTYTLRESLLPNTPGSWTCSFPNAGTPGGFGAGAGGFPCGWGPIGVAGEPYARNRDFGNWIPAQLTVRKELYPPDDPGRFDLLVNGEVVVPGAGDESTTTLEVPPGSYTVAERPVGVPASDYVSALDCKLGTRRARRAAGQSATVVLTAGQRMRCTFHNARRAAPGIAIDKAGPELAMTGATLNYALRVTNVGSVPFAESAVEVTDPGCDDPPELTAKESGSGPDASPGTLDPGDTWSYGCSRATTAPDADCETRLVRNTGSVTATANGSAVKDGSSIVTILRCPEPLAPPEPPAPPLPGGSGAATVPAGVAPPGPVPPEAGVAGAAAVSRIPACLRRGSRVTIAASKVARVVVTVGGQLVHGLSVRPLDDRVTIRLRRNFRPGTYRVKAWITYQRGAGTAPVTLTRTARVCAALAPRFTG